MTADIDIIILNVCILIFLKKMRKTRKTMFTRSIKFFYKVASIRERLTDNGFVNLVGFDLISKLTIGLRDSLNRVCMCCEPRSRPENKKCLKRRRQLKHQQSLAPC